MKKEENPIMNLRLPAEMKAELFKIAEKEDVTPSQIVRKLIKEWLAQGNPPQLLGR